MLVTSFGFGIVLVMHCPWIDCLFFFFLKNAIPVIILVSLYFYYMRKNSPIITFDGSFSHAWDQFGFGVTQLGA